MHGFGIAWGHSFSFLKHEAEVVLCPGQFPVGGALAPFKGTGQVARGVTTEAQIGLGIDVALVRGRTLPACSLRVVLRHAFTGVKHGAEDVLRFSVTLMGGLGEACSRFCESAGVVGSHACLVVGV